MVLENCLKVSVIYVDCTHFYFLKGLLQNTCMLTEKITFDKEDKNDVFKRKRINWNI